MGEYNEFTGFPKGSLKFLKDLGKNNHRDWFNANKLKYEKNILTPSENFVIDMGKALQRRISKKIIAIPKTDKSIFRIHRDTRFSADKTPYKNHVGIFFWEGSRSKMECSGFYFHLEPPYMMLGAGIHSFSKPLLDEYRNSVIDPRHGGSLNRALKKIRDAGDYDIGVKYYKKTPRGFDPEHKNSSFLLHNGLTASVQMKIPPQLHGPELLGLCLDIFADIAPIHNWLVKMTARAGD